MESIIIFRFHTRPDNCIERLSELKRLNPGIKIYGIYGGEEKNLDQFAGVVEYFENNYIIENRTAEWKWKNFDLVLRDWYNYIGKEISFDIAHIIEWDLLITVSLEQAFGKLSTDSIGLTGLVKLDKVENIWDWTSKDPYKTEWDNLLKLVSDKYNYQDEPYGSLGPGLCLPKKFLEAYSTVEIPELAHDELRVPLFGQIFGFKLEDTGFYGKWFDKESEIYFNCNGNVITKEDIEKGIQKGIVAFHPVR